MNLVIYFASKTEEYLFILQLYTSCTMLLSYGLHSTIFFCLLSFEVVYILQLFFYF